MVVSRGGGGGGGGGGRKEYIVIAVQRAVSYTGRSSMTAGNAGLDVALCACVCVCIIVKRGWWWWWRRCWWDGRGGSLPLIPATRITAAS